MNWNFPSGTWAASLLSTLTAVWGALHIAVHIAFAVLVGGTASRRRISFGGRGLWVLATLLGGPLAAAAYWVVNVSPLAPDQERAVPPAPGGPRS